MVDQGDGTGGPAGDEPRDLEAMEACISAVDAGVLSLLSVVASSLAPALERITYPQYRALLLISGLGAVRIGDLARRLGVHQSTVTRTADRLAEAGIARRLENPESRREVLLEITDEGRELLAGVHERRRARLAEIASRLSPEERAKVAEGLDDFVRAAGPGTSRMLVDLCGYDDSQADAVAIGASPGELRKAALATARSGSPSLPR